LIHYTEGDVTLDGRPVARKAAEFPAMKEGQELRTERGRVEVLLSPGVFLRVAENSAVRMVKNQLVDTKLELLAGSALLEVGELDKAQAIQMTVGSTNIEFAKRGLFRLDADPARIRVYDGSALLSSDNGNVTLKEGREATLGAAVVSAKFDKEDEDAFYRWASRRSSYIAMANVTAAKRVHDGSMSFASSSWVYNPYFGLFTYLPLSGLYRSPFGYSYYSPLTVTRIYYRPPVMSNPSMMGGGQSMAGSSMRGMSDMGGRSSMGSYSGSSGMSAPPPSAAAPAAAAGPRTGGGGGGGARGGGGR